MYRAARFGVLLILACAGAARAGTITADVSTNASSADNLMSPDFSSIPFDIQNGTNPVFTSIGKSFGDPDWVSDMLEMFASRGAAFAVSLDGAQSKGSISGTVQVWDNDRDDLLAQTHFTIPSDSLTQTLITGHTTDNGNQGDQGSSVSMADTPEPSTIALFGLGLVGLGLMKRRRKASA